MILFLKLVIWNRSLWPRKKSRKDFSSKQEISVDNYVLQGTSIKEGTIYALINGEIYKKGSRVGEYKIIELEMGYAILENAAEKKIRKLYLSKE